MQTKGCARIMTVDAPKRICSGDRLDGLEKKVDDGFAQVDKRFEKVEGKIDTLDAKFDKKFDRLTYCIITTLIASLAALIGPHVL